MSTSRSEAATWREQQLAHLQARTRSLDLHLVLVGAGHAHLEIVRRMALHGLNGVSTTLVSAGEKHHYSGMVPGYLHGAYTEEQIAFELPPLAALAGVDFVDSRAIGLDPSARRVHLEDGQSLGYDLVSLNVGSLAIGQLDPDVARRAALVKPISRAVDLRAELSALAGQRSAKGRHSVRVAVVGAGAAGYEIAFAASTALETAGCEPQITLLESGEQILNKYSTRFRTRAEKLAARRGIAIRIGAEVTSLTEGALEIGGAEVLPSDLIIWLTGAAPLAWLTDSGLSVDDRGFVLVDSALRSCSHPDVMAVGDCATLAAHRDTPKAGVYSVRQGPVLWETLKALAASKHRRLHQPQGTAAGALPAWARRLLGSERTDRAVLPAYEPQSGFLSILNTADGRALLSYGVFVSHSRWAWHLKDWIDRRFMQRYQSLVE